MPVPVTLRAARSEEVDAVPKADPVPKPDLVAVPDLVPQAVGRVVMPWGSGVDVYLVRGLVWCGLCGRLMVAVRHPDGQRAYSCGLICRQRDLAALPLEQDLLLRALVRAHTTLYGVGRHGPGGLVVSFEEIRRWQWCDVSDRRAVLHTAYTCVIVDADGEPRPVWRHEIGTMPGGGADDQ